MSKLSDLVSKGVRLIVADVPAHAPDAPPREEEIPAEAFAAEPAAPVESAVPASTTDFQPVYDEAGVTLPEHGYGIDKVGEMLTSKRLESLSREVRATAVIAALEAAHVPLRDVLQDAVLRDKALDAFEAAKQRELAELRERSDARVQAIKQEIDSFLRERNAEIEELKRATDAADAAFGQLRTRKQREEERLHDVVSHFVESSDNPITAGGAKPPKPAASDPEKA